jgi:hypothetical protein
MIPKEIQREHIVQAMAQLDKVIDAATRKSRSRCLIHEGRHYPPRLVIAVASGFATGKRMHPSDFSGGSEANDFLIRLGFTIKNCRCGGKKK